MRVSLDFTEAEIDAFEESFTLADIKQLDEEAKAHDHTRHEHLKYILCTAIQAALDEVIVEIMEGISGKAKIRKLS